jgi:hypothetical protein
MLAHIKMQTIGELFQVAFNIKLIYNASHGGDSWPEL